MAVEETLTPTSEDKGHITAVRVRVEVNFMASLENKYTLEFKKNLTNKNTN